MYQDENLMNPKFLFALLFQPGTPVPLLSILAARVRVTRQGVGGRHTVGLVSVSRISFPYPNLLPPPWGGRALTCRLGSASILRGSLPGFQAECVFPFPPPLLPVHCLWTPSVSWPPGRPEPSPRLGSCPVSTRLFPIWTRCTAPFRSQPL